MAEKMNVEARIAHFLRVSEDPGATQAERDTAGREAERLLAKHAIDRLALEATGTGRAEREPIESASIVVSGGRGTTALDGVLGLAAVARALGLVPYYLDRRTTDPWRSEDGPHVRLTITGFRADVALARPLLESLQVQATVAMRQWWRGEPRHRLIPKWDAHLARCAFVRSFGDGAAERLRAGRDAAIGDTGKELVVARRDAAVQAWVREHVPLRSFRDRRSFSGYGRAPGYAAGMRSSGSTRAGLTSTAQ